jgi:hypothetical protein
MPEPTTRQRLRGLALSAAELRVLTKWPPSLIEDYLNILDNLVLLADLLDVEIDQKIEEIPTDFLDGSIPFADTGFLIEDNPGIVWDNTDKILIIRGLTTTEGRAKNEILITAVDSPYTVLSTDHVIYCDTTDGEIDVNLPLGTSGKEYEITNVGTDNNNLNVNPDATEEVFSSGVGEAFILYDGDGITIKFNSTIGWW